MSLVTIHNRLKILIAEKELREGRKLPYRVISQETGVSTSTLTDYVKQRTKRYDVNVLSALCDFFRCQPGDILIYSKESSDDRIG